jgi:hypothetical protein
MTDDELIVWAEERLGELEPLDTAGLQDRYAAIEEGFSKLRDNLRGVHSGQSRQPRPIRLQLVALHNRFHRLAERAEMILIHPPDEERLEGEKPGQWLRPRAIDPEQAEHPQLPEVPDFPPDADE